MHPSQRVHLLFFSRDYGSPTKIFQVALIVSEYISWAMLGGKLKVHRSELLANASFLESCTRSQEGGTLFVFVRQSGLLAGVSLSWKTPTATASH